MINRYKIGDIYVSDIGGFHLLAQVQEFAVCLINIESGNRQCAPVSLMQGESLDDISPVTFNRCKRDLILKNKVTVVDLLKYIMTKESK